MVVRRTIVACGVGLLLATVRPASAQQGDACALPEGASVITSSESGVVYRSTDGTTSGCVFATGTPWALPDTVAGFRHPIKRPALAGRYVVYALASSEVWRVVSFDLQEGRRVTTHVPANAGDRAAVVHRIVAKPNGSFAWLGQAEAMSPLGEIAPLGPRQVWIYEHATGRARRVAEGEVNTHYLRLNAKQTKIYWVRDGKKTGAAIR